MTKDRDITFDQKDLFFFEEEEETEQPKKD